MKTKTILHWRKKPPGATPSVYNDDASGNYCAVILSKDTLGQEPRSYFSIISSGTKYAQPTITLAEE